LAVMTVTTHTLGCARLAGWNSRTA